MAEACENNVSGSGEAWNSMEFMDELRRNMETMTDDDWRRFNDDIRQMKEQNIEFAEWKRHSDDTIKDHKGRTKEVREQREECKQESKLNQGMDKKVSDSVGDITNNNDGNIAEVIGVENKAVSRPNDKDDSIVVVDSGEETEQLNENKDDQLTYNTVSRGEKNDNIIKNVVVESKVVNIESADEVLVGVEFNNGMLVSVDELKRECREGLQIGGLQGVKFSRDVVVGEENA